MRTSLLPRNPGAGLLWRVQLPLDSQRGSPGGKVSEGWMLPVLAWTHVTPSVDSVTSSTFRAPTVCQILYLAPALMRLTVQWGRWVTHTPGRM